MRTLCIGEALVDLVCHEPVASLQEAPAFVPHFGGATANVCVAAARHGAKVALAGGAGDDAWGAWLRDRLAAEGVDLEFFDLLDGAPTPVAFVTVDAQGTPTFTIYGQTIGAGVAALGPRLAEAIGSCDALFLSSNVLVGDDERRVVFDALHRAQELGRPVVFDPNFRLHRWPTTSRAVQESLDCVRRAFLVRCNHEEAFLLTGDRDPDTAARTLLKIGARHAIVTLGAEGALLRGKGVDRDVGGAPARAVDTTGAGDAFMGVVLARLGRSGYYPPAIAAALPEAVAIAARVTEHWGAVS